MNLVLWRLFRERYGPGLDGIGGLYAAGRFHQQGTRVAYFCADPSTAVLEILVQTKTKEATPDDLILGRFEFRGGISITAASTYADEPLPEHWIQDLSITRSIGGKWKAAHLSCLLQVPSVIVPEATNYIMNAEHREAAMLQIVSKRRFEFDSRLLVPPSFD
ncbi:MAG: RES family NAD+ phosphorylase [Acidobacteriaceae bacterium]|nr:RES family NAD+ phosphorylase [Acidobacteriaceae bacterium]